MKNLPDIGSNVLLKIGSEKQVFTIIAHFQDKAVYISIKRLIFLTV